MQQLRTCVITINYRNAADTASCLASLRDSVTPLSIVAVDNSPNDPDLDTLLSAYPEVTFLRAPENLGFGRGNNLGIRWALENTDCEFVFVFNNDAVIKPDSIRQLEIAMEAHPEVGIMVPRIAYMDRPDVLWYGGGEVDWRRGSAVAPGIHGPVDAELALTSREVTFATGCALFVRRSVLRKIGGFDPRFFMYEEDVEFCLRAKEHGIRIRYVPESIVLHRCQGSVRKIGESTGDIWDVKNPKLSFYAFHIIRNRLLNMYFHAHGINGLVFILFFPLYVLRRAIPFAFGGRFDAIMAMAKGGLSFLLARHDSFVNELVTSSNCETNATVEIKLLAQLDSIYIRSRPTKIVSRLISYALFEGRPLTTRGRWINPLVFAHFAVEKRLPQLKKVDRPVFILGTGRSGTTMLGILLSMHRQVGFLNEPKALWHSIYPDEDVIGSYSRGEAHYRLSAAQVTSKVKRNAHRLFGAYLSAVFSPRLVDKYPELVFRVPFVREIFPDARFILLVRNGWDTCASIEKWSQRLGKQVGMEAHDWWGVDQRKWKLMLRELIEPDAYFAGVLDVVSNLTQHTDMAAVEWIVTMREGLRRMRENGDSLMMVRYEDMVENPREVLGNIARFAELSDDETYLRYGKAVLHPAPRHAEFAMHPLLRPLFDETMQALGY